MKRKTFYNVEHAIRYLKHSIISFEKAPIFVHDIVACNASREGYGIKATFIPKSDIATIPIEEPGLDFTPIPLGLLNYQEIIKNKSTYVVYEINRVPVRNWVIGLHDRNIMIISTYGEISCNYPNNFFQSKELAATIKGDYPDYSSAYRTLKHHDSTGAIAFSRKFAIRKKDKNMILIAAKHTDRAVGICKESGPVLSQKYFFLKELLTMALEK